MKYKVLIVVALFAVLAACKHQDHADDHEHDAPKQEKSGGHQHDNVKFQFTTYSDQFELFAEADPFIMGEEISILAHFTWLKNFKPLNDASIKALLTVDGNLLAESKGRKLKDGIFKFYLTPKQDGEGTLVFTIDSQNEEYLVEEKNILVFGDTHNATHWAMEQETSGPNTSVFTKEQSWKVVFETLLPEEKTFGEVIKTTALAQPCHEGEVILSAKSNGVIQFQSKHYADGMYVKKGEEMFIVSGSELAEENSSVRYIEAKNNFEQAKNNYDRAQNLVKDQLISQKDLTEARNNYNNAKAIYENISENFSSAGQIVKSPIDGYINWIKAENGSYVETGTPLLSINNGNRLVLRADVQAKYMKHLPHISDVKINVIQTGKTFSLAELNGDLLSFGKSTNTYNYLVPVTYEIDNVEEIVSGSFVVLCKYRFPSRILPKQRNTPEKKLTEPFEHRLLR